jgi:cytochrome d ubiquinol oxidase subunit I
MDLDPIFLSRLQFAITIMFHYLFPPLSIGLSWMMVVMEGAYLKTGNKEYEAIARFWTSIFAVVFAMGVATGIVMEFQFGTNWKIYSEFVGDIFGAALAAEGIFAFFLESGFLAVLVFGWDKVGPKMHFFSTCMVALGALFSSVWIIVANSWQQTPAGYHIVDGRAELTSFWEAVFNPSTVPRLLHTWTGAGILGAFFVLSISAYYILKNKHVEPAKKMFKLALVLGLVMSLLAPAIGDINGKMVAREQPTKMAAFEALYETSEGGTALSLWGFPDDEAKVVRGEIAIPKLLSFLVHSDFNKPVAGLDQFPEEDHPPVALTYYSYHIMITLGMVFVLLTVLAAFFWWRGTLFEKRWLLWIFVFAVPLPFITNEVGWVAAEVGRQPWIVWGMLRTADAGSPTVSGAQVLGSIIMFSVIYFFMFVLWLYIMDMKIRKGPDMTAAYADHTTSTSLADAASALTEPGGPSMTSVRDEEK